MSEDIVKYLRLSRTQFNRHAEAADEIERLNGIVEHLSAQLRLQMKANDKAWEAYKEVVGDD